MLTARKRVALEAIDLNSLAESETSHEAIEFEVLLNQTPDEKWVEEFDIAYRTLPNSIKPPVAINGDRMLISFLPRYANDLQAFFEFIQSVMRRAEEEMDKTEAIAKHSHQPERLNGFRDILRKVRVNEG
jgi:hypothetical protein